MHRLALAIGGYTVEQLENEMSFAELQDWIAFYDLEPFGQDWLQTSTVASAVVSCHLEKGKSIYRDHFLPVKHDKEQSENDMLALMRSIKKKDSETK